MKLRRLVKLPGLIILIVISLWGFIPSTAVFGIHMRSNTPNNLAAQVVQIPLPRGCSTNNKSTELAMPVPSQATIISNRQGILAYQVIASVAQVIAFQEAYLPQYGWESSMPPIVAGAETTLSYTQADLSASLTVKAFAEHSARITLLVSGPDSSL